MMDYIKIGTYCCNKMSKVTTFNQLMLRNYVLIELKAEINKYSNVLMLWKYVHGSCNSTV